MDGVDAVLAEFAAGRLRRVIASHTARYPAALRAELLRLAHEQHALSLADFCRLDQAVALAFAGAATGLLKRSRMAAGRVRALGSHGQTVFHSPQPPARATLQLGDPNLIAARTGITTVADFRRRDLALGGQGAPLVPAFHHAMFASAREARCVVNIGGIANLTVLPGGDARHVTGFDTGPGNGLMDEWAARHGHGTFDRGGRWSASGEMDSPLLQRLSRDPWFHRAPPKSTGRDTFNLRWLKLQLRGRVLPENVQRTLLELTARSVADAVTRHGRGARRILVCGGGVHNVVLMQRLRNLLSPRVVQSTAAHGLDPRHVEAAAFAWLALRTVHGKAGNLPAVTGASAPAVLGGIHLV